MKAYPILPTYLHHVFRLPGEMRLFRAGKNVFPSTGTYYANVREGREDEYEMWHRVVGDMTGHDYGLRSDAMPDPDRTPLVKLPVTSYAPLTFKCWPHTHQGSQGHMPSFASRLTVLFFSPTSPPNDMPLTVKPFYLFLAWPNLRYFHGPCQKKQTTGVTKYGLW